jgi:uncharacterized coiled-coil DUF342 family protein
MDITFIELLVGLFAICTALVGSTIWFLKWYSGKVATDNEKIIFEIKNNNMLTFTSLKDDLKEFRSHFDTRIGDVYSAVDSKNRELKDFVSKELDYIRSHVDTIEGKITQTRDHTHELEKEILRVQSTIGKDYITKDDLRDYLKSRRESDVK